MSFFKLLSLQTCQLSFNLLFGTKMFLFPELEGSKGRNKGHGGVTKRDDF